MFMNVLHSSPPCLILIVITGFNVILYVYYKRFVCSLADKLGLHLIDQHNDLLFRD